ncbi:nucleoside-diphosphate-sugar epimerase [Lacrimispora xylanisolvens]|uniref:Nucleoside-diphosphate-sugar epimerase n=1 Tax=Lacrimispora xylanisolvens TaxID=384636 RepID=A0A2S6HZI6_9FIRM|nr:NAD(P)-dependent oxidoreductase [Hungatella xylanolytica]PPK83563.1 nucleoside-diphosphate-sugar epimerase [Hungatella xylanolytica]
MNVVVTGATSFLGRAVANRLLKQGSRVYAVVRPGSGNLRYLPSNQDGLVIIERELGELDTLDQVIDEPCQAFYHFGWDGSGSENRMKREVQQKNVVDALKALEGARRLGCSRFLFSGSQAEYGIHKGSLSEETECSPVSEYGKAKLDFLKQATKKTNQWQQEGISSMEYIHARIFSVYGPGDHPWSLVESCLRAFGKGEYISLGECTQMWNFLYLEDCVRALILLMEQEKESVSGIYNVAAPERETKPLREYIRQMYETMGFHGSYSYGRRRPNAEGLANLIPDISKLEKNTGFSPLVSFSEGVKKTCGY